MKAFRVGLPGRIKLGLTARLSLQKNIALPVNSGPLSRMMASGKPRVRLS